MTGCEWCEEPDGFRYLYADYRDLDETGRHDVLRESSDELARHPGMRSLVDVRGMEFDPAWFKAVKDANPAYTENGPRMAVLCERRESAARARTLSFLAGGPHCQPFTTRDEAIAWLREQ